ncbi:3'-5' exonuclease [Paratractidigestivibacter sp.]|uniref:3'-5' exonuclease n=1 Tax=Paratractidigestivibacter sp. TaxID=2847316 RepID=UPI002ABD3227|nr:3'-5' exonuclease [Paratractidigestivibacter sp.]
MDLSQAIDCASALALPFFLDEAALTAERQKNEEALKVLLDTWKNTPAGAEPFGFDLVLGLADRNRGICDLIGADKLRDVSPSCLARKLADADLVHAVAHMQHRPDAEVAAIAGPGLDDLNIAYVDAPVSGMVMGIDIETTDRDPARGYVVNIGLEFMDLAADAKPHDAFAGYCGIPDMYAEKGVPLEFIHHITWDDLKDCAPLRQNPQMQKAILAAMCAYPYMAHNAAFEDSWFMLNIAGYAEARKVGKICIIDSRDICRRVDPEVRTLPRESRPATLENWARRRGTLAVGESEVHLGLDDVELMLRTVQAEFAERNMFR